MASISVLVPVWNNARFLGAALQSALAQTRVGDEIIVVDDGSDDDSAAVAEALGVRCVREPHRGVAVTRNTAWRLAQGDLIAWLDSDDLWTPDKLAVQAAYMEAHPDVGLTLTHQRLFFEEGVARPYWVRDEMLAADSPALGTCSLMVRRELLERVGGFDVKFAASEDTDWMFRAVQAGATQVVLPETLLLRRVHERNVTTTVPLSKGRMLGMLRAAIGRRRGDA